MPIYLDTIPYEKAMSRNLALPKGVKSGFGNLVFLLSPTPGESIKMINNMSVSNDNRYHWYYYPMLYKGRVNSRTYNIRHIEERKRIYDDVENATNLTGFPFKPLSKGDNRNTYFDLCTYMDIFFGMTPKLPYIRKMKEFWSYTKSILNNPDTNNFENKLVLINLDNYCRFKGSLQSLFTNPIFILYYTMYKNRELITDLNLDFIIYGGGFILKIKPSTCTKDSYKVFLREINRMLNNIKNASPLDVELDEKTDLVIQKESIKVELAEKYNFTGNEDQPVEDLETVYSNKNTEVTIPDKVNDIVEHNTEIAKTLLDTADNAGDFIKTATENELDTDKEVINDVYQKISKYKLPKSPINTKRDELLRKNQENLKVGNMTINDIQKIKAADVKLESKKLHSVLHTTNDNMKDVKFASFEKVYNKNLLKKDIINDFTALNKKDMPLFIRKIDVVDTSNKLNYKETYKIEFEDSNRTRHTVSVDVPKFLEEKFLWLNGNKLQINKQDFFYPVVKTQPDEVQIVTNYNKMFIRRIGTRSLGSVEKLKKFAEKNEEFHKYVKFGNVAASNKNCLSIIENDELSKVFVKFKSGNTEIYFNQQEALEVANNDKITIPDNNIFVGYNQDKPIFIDINSQLTKDNKNIAEIIIESLPEELQNEYSILKSGKRLMYNACTIHAQSIPLITLLCFWEGLTEVLKKSGIKYRMSDKLPKDLKLRESYIKFSDSYLIYEDSVANSLLLNGLNTLDTNLISITDMDDSTPYVEYFNKVYGNRYITNTLFNAYQFFIDEITLELLDDINLPTDIVSVALYANNLLADNAYTDENNQRIYRVRSNEVVPAILHYIIANNYIQYRISGGKKKFSIPKDALIKELLKLQTVEDYSTLNPIVEMEKSRTITAKGWRGANVDRAYTMAKRSYDPSMVGIFAMNTPSDGNCGVTRTLSLEPNILNARGYLQVTDKKDIKKLKDVNLLSAGELLTTLGVRHDDALRTAMATKQSKHVIPVKKSSPVLISNGADEVARFNLSSDFIINAEQDGFVNEVNEDVGLMILQYKDGTTQAVDLNSKMAKNGGGGFYLSNKLVTNFKEGDKFKKDDCIAYHKDFFTSSKINGVRLNMGSLEKVAIMSSYNTYEDSNFVTKKFSRDTATEMVFNQSAVIGKNSSLSYICKIGDTVDIGDTLVKFDTSYDESELNKFLSAMSDELREEADEISRNNIKATHSGVIDDIKIYSTVEISELSPTLKKVVGKYYEKINTKKKILDKYDKNDTIVKCGMLFTETTGKVEPNKYGLIKGYDVGEGILIEFYIKHTDILGVGDKVASFTAMKNIVGEVVPEGYEPWSDFRPDEEISSTLGQQAILQRMTQSIVNSLLGNKVIVEHKRCLYDIWVKPGDSKTKRKKMETITDKLFKALDPSGTNSRKYMNFLQPLSDKEFNKFFKDFFADENEYFILDMIDFERDVTLEMIEAAAEVIHIPLYETLYMPHINMNKDKPIGTRLPVPVGYINYKRTQQTLSKKNGMSTSISKRSAITGQVTGSDKNGRESDLENSMLTALGADYMLRELNGPRADDPVMKTEMLTNIQNKGYVTLKELTNDPANKTTLNTVDVYMLGMSLKSDLVTNGLMLKKTINEEMEV